jgi:hypothetical protein
VTPTKEQHDAVVAAKGRPYTDRGMRAARSADGIAPEVAGLTIVDEYVNHHRKGRRDA